VGSNTIKHVVK